MPGELTPKTLIVVVGPTAVGKTAVSIKVARHYNAEIVSADSRQIFREMAIGTAKPSPLELAEVKHHFIDSHSIHDSPDAASFAEAALDTINKLFKEHDFVVMCGGSGLYIRAVLDGFDDIPDIAPEVREEIQAGYQASGLAWLQEKMRTLDPEHYERLDQQNPQRLMRALEVRIGTGQSIASFQNKKAPRVHDFNVIMIGLDLPREELFERINHRMEIMISDGLFEEARELYPWKHLNALQTVGYQEIFGYFDGLYDREEAIRLLKRNSRRYAKRQLTWFRRDERINWFSPHDVDAIIAFIQTKTRN